MQHLVSVIYDRSDLATSDEQAAIDVFNDRLQSEGHWAIAGGLGVPDRATVIDNRAEEACSPTNRSWSRRSTSSASGSSRPPDLDVALKLAAEGSKIYGTLPSGRVTSPAPPPTCAVGSSPPSSGRRRSISSAPDRCRATPPGRSSGVGSRSSRSDHENMHDDREVSADMADKIIGVRSDIGWSSSSHTSVFGHDLVEDLVGRSTSVTWGSSN